MIALAAAAAAVPRPAPPVVTGPRDTTLERPVYTFRARGALGFRCAFDRTVLHRCARRYSERLEPGQHTLRVRSVGRRGARSRVVAVRVRVRLLVPELQVVSQVAVGAGAGVPAPNANGTWVPITSDGSLVRVSRGPVVDRYSVGPPTTSTGALDSARADDRRSTERDIWVASDAGARISRVDPETGSVTARIDVAERPGGLADDSRSLWAFHFLQGTITRVDLATATATRLEVPGARATGIAAGEGTIWLLTTQPARVLEIDPATAAVRRAIDLRPPFRPRRSLIDTWWLVFGGDAVWATLPNHGAVARVDTRTGAVRYVRLPYGDPFGVSMGAGSVWVATDRAVLQLDPGTGALQAAALLPRADRTGFVSVVFGYASVWVTNYDRGTLTQLVPPGTPAFSRR